MKTITENKFLNLSQQERDNFTGIIKHHSGTLEYFKNGKYHCEDGPAAIYSDGSEYWYFEGKEHRIDGAAITYSNGSEFWYFEGKLHRIGGPAILSKLGNIEQYWIYGQECTKEAHDLWVDLMKMKELNIKKQRETIQ